MPQARRHKQAVTYFIVVLTIALLLFAGQSKAQSVGISVLSRHQSLPVREGVFTGRVKWTYSPETGTDILLAKISFDPSTTRQCQSLRLVQAARVSRGDGTPFVWVGGLSARNAMSTAKSTFIDHDPATCRKGEPCSPFYRDHWANPQTSQEGQNLKGVSVTSSLEDAPFGWTEYEKIELETCAVCVNQSRIESYKINPLRIMGCFHWSGEFLQVGERNVPKFKASPWPTGEFLESLARFKAYYNL